MLEQHKKGNEMKNGMMAVTLLMAISSGAAAEDIAYRSFSASAAIGPPAEAFAAKLDTVTTAALGPAGEIHLVKLPGIPAIPGQFGGDIVAAVAAGEMGGGFDAAYISGSDLNKTWGFVFNSGVPFGPTFDEFLGFLYGGSPSGLDTVQSLLGDRVMALPIVGSPEQLSGYFMEPMGDAKGHRGIGLAGLCEQHWVLRYLPPGQDVLNRACDDLVGSGRIARKNITFIQAVPGGGSLVDAVIAGTLHGFEFATPLDDVSQLFVGVNNPGTVGLKFVHTPGWQQQFLVTWLLVNKPLWNALTPGQRALFQTVARDHLTSSYAANLQAQGPALSAILGANQGTRDDMVMSRWPERDLERLQRATNLILNTRVTDQSLPAADRANYAKILEALRLYVRANDAYWDHRQVPTRARFDGWVSPTGDKWEAHERR